MMSAPLLSICIPTFNRAILLRECLASIDLAGLDDLVEVTVSDNASEDDTLAVLEEFRATLPLRWVVQERNVGPDGNFDAVVSISQGEYCWLLGSDDVVVPDGIRRLLDAIRSARTDIVQFGYTQTDVTLRPRHDATPPAGTVDTSREGLSLHFERVPNMSLLFTFMSAFAFRRSAWMKQRQALQAWIGSSYVQAFVIHAALRDGATLSAIDAALVLARGDNPNEFNSVPGRFIALDANTMARLIREVYQDDPRLWQAIGRPFHRSYPPRALAYVTAQGGARYLADCREALIKLGFPRSFIQGLVWLDRLRLLPVMRFGIGLRRRLSQKQTAKAH